MIRIPFAPAMLWGEREDRILVSFDKTTLAGQLANHLQAGHHAPGVSMLRRGSRLSQVVAHLALVAYASSIYILWNEVRQFGVRRLLTAQGGKSCLTLY